SAVISVTIPEGIAEASGTQNNYVLAFWLVCLIYFTLLFIAKPTLLSALFIGASMGLAILTKGTAYIYVAPIAIWIAVGAVRTLSWQAWKPLAIIASLGLLINSGQYIRNLALTGTFIGNEPNEPYVNTVISPAVLISNAVRNLALHLETPNVEIN